MSATLEPRTSPLWISSAEGSPAKTCPMPEMGRASSKEPDPAFGSSSPEWFASYDRGSWWSRTLGLFSLGGSESFSATWPRRGMMRNGVAYVLPTSGRRISESASSWWPTPTLCGNHNRKGASPTSGDGLATAAGRWATPTASDSDGGVGHSGQGSLGRQAPRDPTSAAGALSPAWVGQLMGFPDGWTDGLPAPAKPSKSGKPRGPRKA